MAFPVFFFWQGTHSYMAAHFNGFKKTVLRSVDFSAFSFFFYGFFVRTAKTLKDLLMTIHWFNIKESPLWLRQYTVHMWSLESKHVLDAHVSICWPLFFWTCMSRCCNSAQSHHHFCQGIPLGRWASELKSSNLLCLGAQDILRRSFQCMFHLAYSISLWLLSKRRTQLPLQL